MRRQFVFEKKMVTLLVKEPVRVNGEQGLGYILKVTVDHGDDLFFMLLKDHKLHWTRLADFDNGQGELAEEIRLKIDELQY